jgi:ABC-2 type transport system permease protein
VISAALFAAAAAGVLIVVAIATTAVSLPASRWCELAAVLIAGTAPFALLGIALGYWAPPRGALPIANLLYLGLSYGGGLWFRPQRLPGVVERISPILPTRALRDLLAVPALGTPFPWGSTAALAVFSMLFTALALAGYRRDEGRHFR